MKKTLLILVMAIGFSFAGNAQVAPVNHGLQIKPKKSKCQKLSNKVYHDSIIAGYTESDARDRAKKAKAKCESLVAS